MAKLKETEDKTQETPVVETPVIETSTAVTETSTTEAPTVEALVVEVPKEEQKNEGKPKNKEEKQIEKSEGKTEIPEYVSAILKRFSDLESVYVDSHGGTFTVQTAEIIRKNAVLYKNPFYNQSKT